MENYKTYRDAVMREILLYVCEHKIMPDDAYEQDKAKVVKECVDAGYLENVRAIKTLDGSVHFAAAQPFVTQNGLAFLYPETGQETNTGPIVEELKRMNDDVRQNHAEESSEKRKDRRFQLINTILSALLVSVLTLLVEHWKDVVSFLASLFHLK